MNSRSHGHIFSHRPVPSDHRPIAHIFMSMPLYFSVWRVYSRPFPVVALRTWLAMEFPSIHLRFVSLHPTPTPCPHIFGLADDQWRDALLSATTRPGPTFLPLSLWNFLPRISVILLSGTNSKCSKCVASVRPFPWRCSSADPVTSCYYMRCLALSSGIVDAPGGKWCGVEDESLIVIDRKSVV